MRLAGQVAIITGAAGGQGAAEARLLVEQGAQVVAGDIGDDAGEALAKELGDGAIYHHLDVCSEDDWRSAVAAATAAFGKVTALVN
ncbi:MAG: SDR family NAD(P)-dependent oxidoreductase, partial [Acidimicrobiales bacterium]